LRQITLGVFLKYHFTGTVDYLQPDIVMLQTLFAFGIKLYQGSVKAYMRPYVADQILRHVSIYTLIKEKQNKAQNAGYDERCRDRDNDDP
jgi:hypothetical protein